MNIKMKQLKEMPFFLSFMESTAKAIIDVKAFNIWLEQIQNVEFLSESDEIDRKNAYMELKEGKHLNLRDSMKSW
ncbi:MAG: hypothetical protein HQK70_07885 [Desulfamplus sp.]|nr:hypothetical protein [Desulfamplus sp.]